MGEGGHSPVLWWGGIFKAPDLSLQGNALILVRIAIEKSEMIMAVIIDYA